MQQTHKPVSANPAAVDEPVLSADEIKQLAQLLDVLMEVDFWLNRQQVGAGDD